MGDLRQHTFLSPDREQTRDPTFDQGGDRNGQQERGHPEIRQKSG